MLTDKGLHLLALFMIDRVFVQDQDTDHSHDSGKQADDDDHPGQHGGHLGDVAHIVALRGRRAGVDHKHLDRQSVGPSASDALVPLAGTKQQ